MNIVVPLTSLNFLKEFYYPTIMQKVAGKPVIEHTIESLKLSGQYHFILNWTDHTKYSIGNYLESVFPGSNIVVIKDRVEGDADSLLKLNIDGPTIVFDGLSQLMWNPNFFLDRLYKNRADAGVAVFSNYNVKYPHIRFGGYHRNSVSRIVDFKTNLACAGLYYFKDISQYYQIAPDIIRDSLHLEYKPVEISTILNKMLDDGARCLYHKVGRRDLNSLESLNRFENA